MIQTRHRVGREAKLSAEDDGGPDPPRPLCPELANVPAYVLNLDRRTDRLRAMSRLMYREPGLPWLAARACRVSAPDGSAFGEHVRPELVTPEAWERARRRDAQRNVTIGGPLTMGGTALILGHARVWEHIVHSEARFAIVMEDDIAEVHASLEPLLCLLMSGEFEAPQSMVPGDLESVRRSVAGMDPDWDYVTLSPCAEAVNDTGALRVVRRKDHCTGMLFMRRGAARKALRSIFPVGGPAQSLQLDDPDGFFQEGLKGYTATPRLVVQGSSDTDVQILSGGLIQGAPGDRLLPDCEALAPGEMVQPTLMEPTLP